jgi:hypothetical protein
LHCALAGLGDGDPASRLTAAPHRGEGHERRHALQLAVALGPGRQHAGQDEIDHGSRPLALAAPAADLLADQAGLGLLVFGPAMSSARLMGKPAPSPEQEIVIAVDRRRLVGRADDLLAKRHDQTDGRIDLVLG